MGKVVSLMIRFYLNLVRFDLNLSNVESQLVFGFKINGPEWEISNNNKMQNKKYAAIKYLGWLF